MKNREDLFSPVPECKAKENLMMLLSKFDQVRAIYKRRSPCQDTANVTTIVKDFTMFLADKFEFLSFRYGKRKCKLN